MKRHFILPALLFTTMAATAQQKGKPAAAQQKGKPAAAKPKAATAGKQAQSLKNNNDSVSYAFGISLGEYLKNQGVDKVNLVLLNKAIDQCLKNGKTLFDINAANAVIGKMNQEKVQKTSLVEKSKGEKFLIENKKRAGVKVTASGLQYEVLKEGNGPKPALTDTISAHYAGTLLNGKEFDNSYKRGQPLSIPVAGVIPGWTEALQLMPVGSKWKLYIPSALAYGDYGAGADIPGGSALIFEIELLDIVNKKAQ